MNIQYSENSINSSNFITDFVKLRSCTQYDTNHITWAKAWGNQVFGDKKGNINGEKYIKQLMNSEAMASQTDNQIGNLCSDFHCSIVVHTLLKIHNFLISYPILLKLFCKKFKNETGEQRVEKIRSNMI